MNKPLIALFAALSAIACDGGSALNPDPVERSCTNYCEQRNMCDDEVDVDSCTADCMDSVGDCQADEQDQALDELDECAEESCDDIGACTVGAALECYFGI